MKYSDGLKRDVVIRHQNGESISELQTNTGIPRSTLYSWLKPYQTETTATGEKITPREFMHLKRRVNKLENMIKVLKMVNCTATSPLKEKLAALEALQDQFEIHTLCEALDVPRGTFYNHVFRNKRDNAWYIKRREKISQKIWDIYEENHQIFGAGKIHAILTAQGEVTSKRYVAELMREMGIVSMSPSAKKEYKHL